MPLDAAHVCRQTAACLARACLTLRHDFTGQLQPQHSKQGDKKACNQRSCPGLRGLTNPRAYRETCTVGIFKLTLGYPLIPTNLLKTSDKQSGTAGVLETLCTDETWHASVRYAFLRCWSGNPVRCSRSGAVSYTHLTLPTKA